jgi:hypothetical protein
MLSGLAKARSWRASSFSKFEHSTHDECYGDLTTVNRRVTDSFELCKRGISMRDRVKCNQGKCLVGTPAAPSDPNRAENRAGAPRRYGPAIPHVARQLTEFYSPIARYPRKTGAFFVWSGEWRRLKTNKFTSWNQRSSVDV